ncbi:MAG: noncanonical pyrimidine nucleotidase, YjjG family [Flavobacterium sp.]|nr:noncanonical pyrimidine nucleotidase, YjjG family [Flavobacterium sp.]
MKKYNHITHIFFDLDHTLWDFDKNSEKAFETIFKNNCPEIDINDFIKVYAPINQAVWKLYQKDQITSNQLKYMRLKQSFDAINFEIDDTKIEMIAEDYIRILPENNHLFDGTIEVLEYLKAKYTLHIITNGFADVQNKKLDNSGIRKYFQTITNSENAGAKKPNPIIYDFALNVANARKANAIMIGDCIDADVNGAIEFGIDAIYFNFNNSKVAFGIQQINHLKELLNHF